MHEKIVKTFFIDVQNIKCISDTYFVLTLLKLKIKLSKMTKKEEALNLNHVEPSERKSLACPVSLC